MGQERDFKLQQHSTDYVKRRRRKPILTLNRVVGPANYPAIDAARLGTGGFASNGYGDLSPGKYGLASCFLIEVIATFFFLYVIIGTTSKGAAVGFAGIPIGLGLTLIHLFLIPVTNASVNPARSTGPALFAGSAYMAQLWLFWVAPILGAAIAGVVSRWQHDLPDAD